MQLDGDFVIELEPRSPSAVGVNLLRFVWNSDAVCEDGREWIIVNWIAFKCQPEFELRLCDYYLYPLLLHVYPTVEMVVLVWGIRLCIVVRKAPSEFNESRFISMAIYNEFLLSIFLNVSM